MDEYFERKRSLDYTVGMGKCYRFLPIAAAAALLLLIACAPMKPIRIGYMAALSGRLSQLGVASREALQIVVDEWNAKGGIRGRPIELVIADDKSDPATGTGVIEELAAVGVTAIIGPLTSNMLPAVERLRNRGILIISPTISTERLSGRDDHFIRLIPGTAQQGRVLSLLMHDDSVERAAVVYDTSNAEYTEDVLTAFRERYRAEGGTIAALYPYDSREDPDFAELSRKIVADPPDGLVLICSAIDAASVAQQLWKEGRAIPLYGSRWTKTDDILEYGGRAVEGMKMVSGYFDCDGGRAQAFNRSFIDRVGYAPGFAPIYTFEAATILFTALEAAPSTGLEELKRLIVDSEHPAYCGTVYIDAYGDTVRTNAYTLIRNGAFEAYRLE